MIDTGWGEGPPPICPEHGIAMRYEAQPNWWRCAPDCPIRVFHENRQAYVPASTVTPLRSGAIGIGGVRLWSPRRCSSTTWRPLKVLSA